MLWQGPPLPLETRLPVLLAAAGSSSTGDQAFMWLPNCTAVGPLTALGTTAFTCKGHAVLQDKWHPHALPQSYQRWCTDVARLAGSQDEASSKQGGKKGLAAEMEPLLPDRLQAAYLALKHSEVKLWDEHMQRLSRHNGPDAAKHVPRHCLDATRTQACYPPCLFTVY